MEQLEHVKNANTNSKKSEFLKLLKYVFYDSLCRKIPEKKPRGWLLNIFYFMCAWFWDMGKHTLWIIPLSILISYPIFFFNPLVAAPVIYSILVSLYSYIATTIIIKLYTFLSDRSKKYKVHKKIGEQDKREEERLKIWGWVANGEKAYKYKTKFRSLQDEGYDLIRAEEEIFSDYMQSERDKYINTPGETAEIKARLERFLAVYSYLYGVGNLESVRATMETKKATRSNPG